MKPVLYEGIEGRANPKGISYLYLSTDLDTSLAEQRPNRGQLISSAQFKVKRDLRIVDCYSIDKHYDLADILFNHPPESQDDTTSAVWSMINAAFTKPVNNNDSTAEYVPTQFLAEFFKSENFDGFCFKSGVGNGLNILLYNLDDADLVNCTVMETKNVSYEFEECANRYFVKTE